MLEVQPGIPIGNGNRNGTGAAVDGARIGEIDGGTPAPVLPSVLEGIGVNRLVGLRQAGDGGAENQQRKRESRLQTALSHTLYLSLRSRIGKVNCGASAGPGCRVF